MHVQKTLANEQPNGETNPFRTPDPATFNAAMPLADNASGRSFLRRGFGITSIVGSLILGGLIFLQWGHHGGTYYVLPLYVIAPFTIIGLSAFITVRSSAFLVGAATGCFLVTAPTFALLCYDTFLAPAGGGVNIGLALLLMAFPLITFMAGGIGGVVGSLIGRWWSRKQR